jgi:hypothetical protein
MAVYCLYSCIRAQNWGICFTKPLFCCVSDCWSHITPFQETWWGYLSLSRAEVQLAIYMQRVAVLSTRNEFVRQLADVVCLEVLTNSHFCVCRVHMHTWAARPNLCLPILTVLYRGGHNVPMKSIIKHLDMMWWCSLFTFTLCSILTIKSLRSCLDVLLFTSIHICWVNWDRI